VHGFRLAPTFWACVFRVIWLCGISPDVEPLGPAKQRAVKAADILVTFAKASSGPVPLFFLNRLPLTGRFDSCQDIRAILGGAFLVTSVFIPTFLHSHSSGCTCQVNTDEIQTVKTTI